LSTSNRFSKDPQEFLDYKADWSAEMTKIQSTLASSTWFADSDDIEIVNATIFDDTSATVWVRGGVEGVKYRLTNHVVAESGQIYERSIILSIKQQ
jgi:hypothetical protein